MVDAIFFQYFIIGIVVALGPFAGKLLSKIAPEELKIYDSFLIILKKALFLVLLVFLCFVIKDTFMRTLAGFILLYYIYDVFKYKVHDKNNYYLLYTALGLFLGFVDIKNIIYAGFLAFLIGIPTALLNNHRKLSVYVKMFIVFIVFYIVSVIIYLA